MSSAIHGLARRGLITPPSYVVHNLCYEVLTGSVAYGVSSDTSDQDIYGFCIPTKEILFPHLAGVIPGFGNQGQRFEQYQQPRVADAEGGEYDFTIYNIVKYFRLCADCNPNMIDSLFVPENCIKHITSVGQLVRDNRGMFLSRRAWPRFKGYAYEQVKKLGNKQPTGKRLALVQAHGYDTKFAYHIVRLLDEAEQILTTGDVDIQRNNDELKAIRRGEWSEDRVHDHFAVKSQLLEEAFLKSDLPAAPDEGALKGLLVRCLETHYGTLEGCLVREDAYVKAIRDIGDIIDELRLKRSHAPGDGRREESEEDVRGPGEPGEVPDAGGVPQARQADDRPLRPS